MKTHLMMIPVMALLAIAGFKACAQNTEVIIISTNDVHGRIDNFGKMAAYVKALKQSHPNVFVFNAGDLINGNPVVDEAKDKGAPVIDLMNRIPYDVSCMGNHEFENGEAVLQRRIDQSTSVYVDANVTAAPGSPFRGTKPYTILHATDGTAIGVLGLTASSSNPCLIPGITVTEPIKVGAGYQKLKDSCQVLIAVTHIGYKADSVMATRLNTFDVIVGGHSHTELPHGVMVNGVLITQAGDKLRFVGKTVLTIKDHHIINKTFEMVDLAKLTTTDPDVQRRINFYNSDKRFNKIAGYSKNGFASKEELGSLKADALAHTLKLDIAFDHARNVSYGHFPKGKITVGDIYEIDSYDYRTIRYSLTPAEIRALIINSIKKSEAPVLFGSGLTYTLNEDANGQVHDVVIKPLNGGVFNEEKHYSVGMNSFIACHYMGGHAMGESVPVTASDALLKYLKQHPLVNYSGVKRILIEKK